MAKMVRYNGGTESYFHCTAPTNLVDGEIYEVVHENNRAWQTDYILKDIDGHFNSFWFDEVYSEKIFIALSHYIPMVGQKFKCTKLELINGQPKLKNITSNVVTEVSDLGNDIYQVTTSSENFIVQIG